MNKKLILFASVFSIVGLLYGTIFNAILSGKEIALALSFGKEILIGIVAGITYIILVTLFSFVYDKNYLGYYIKKRDINIAKILFGMIILVGITVIVANNKPILLNYMWMNIVNIVFVVVLIEKSEYDGKSLV